MMPHTLLGLGLLLSGVAAVRVPISNRLPRYNISGDIMDGTLLRLP